MVPPFGLQPPSRMNADDETQLAPPAMVSAEGLQTAWSQEAEPLPWGRWHTLGRLSRRLDGRIIGAALALVVAVAVVVVALGSPIAHEDANSSPVQQPLPSPAINTGPAAEAQLWKLLAADGITVTNRAEILANAHSDCEQLRDGKTVRGVIDEINQRYPGLGYELAAKSVLDGVTAFCPLDKGVLG